MKIDLTTLRPWPDIHRMISNMVSLTIEVDGVKFKGEAELSIDDARNATLEISLPKAKAPKAAK